MIKLGSKTDGFKTKHLKSECCNANVRFESYGKGFSIKCWCEECGKYIYNGRIEGLIAFWMGNLKETTLNKGYTPEWINKKDKDVYTCIKCDHKTNKANLNKFYFPGKDKQFVYQCPKCKSLNFTIRKRVEK